MADEREGLLGYLAQQRYVLKLTAHGLTDEQARLAPTSSSLTVGGLIKHVTAVEAYWLDLTFQRPIPESQPDDYLANFRFTEDESLEGLLSSYDEVAAKTDADMAGADLGQAVPVPKGVPWFPDVEAWSVRWVLLHLIAETARHAGHADIVREGIDGATAFPLMAAAENWPPMPYMKAWEPASA
ncbi:MAG TPA: DinB family protein [Acidimicrobiales bacterium]|nr:DinB family protein [Acidimicrobiales bacterium]